MVGCLRERNRNQALTIALYLIAFFASIIAAILTARSLSKDIAIVLSALPSAAALALAIFRPDARAQWWWAKYGKLDDLVLEMEREGKAEAVASKELREFLRVHEPKYPGFGPIPSGGAA
jgi:hypothetical protein